jgi:hypothetical protein
MESCRIEFILIDLLCKPRGQTMVGSIRDSLTAQFQPIGQGFTLKLDNGIVTIGFPVGEFAAEQLKQTLGVAMHNATQTEQDVLCHARFVLTELLQRPDLRNDLIDDVGGKQLQLAVVILASSVPRLAAAPPVLATDPTLIRILEKVVQQSSDHTEMHRCEVGKH